MSFAILAMLASLNIRPTDESITLRVEAVVIEQRQVNPFEKFVVK
jgi:hypothetical protein